MLCLCGEGWPRGAHPTRPSQLGGKENVPFSIKIQLVTRVFQHSALKRLSLNLSDIPASGRLRGQSVQPQLESEYYGEDFPI